MELQVIRGSRFGLRLANQSVPKPYQLQVELQLNLFLACTCITAHPNMELEFFVLQLAELAIHQKKYEACI